jgi:LysM repeat protein
MLVPRTGNEGDNNQIKLIQERLKRLEDKIVKLEEVNERLAKVEPLGKEISMLKDAKVSEKGTKTRYHQVRTGQTLWGTSRRYGLTVEELRKLNGLAPGAVIHPGQKLIVSPANNK